MTWLFLVLGLVADIPPAPYREPRTRAVCLGRPYNYKRPHKLRSYLEIVL